MTLALAVTTLQLLAGAIPRCYVVTNTDILLLPSCDLGPAAIGALTERPPPSSSTAQRRPPESWRSGRANARAARPVAAVPALDPNTLERRLHAEQQRRIAAEARRIAAERERDAALRERDAALRELEVARRSLAVARSGD